MQSFSFFELNLKKQNANDKSFYKKNIELSSKEDTQAFWPLGPKLSLSQIWKKYIYKKFKINKEINLVEVTNVNKTQMKKLTTNNKK